MIVVDASAMLEVLLRTPAGEIVERRLFRREESFHAPQLLDVEVAHVIRRYALAGAIDEARGSALLSDLTDFPLRRYPHTFLLQRIWELRDALTAYDAAYVALAEVLDAPLLTRDRRIAASASHHARIEVI